MARRRLTHAILAGLIGTLAVFAPACDRKAPEPGGNVPAATAEQSSGDPVRLAVLSPALTIMLSDLGLRDRIVGRHGYDLILGVEVPVVGNELGLDYEALIGVRPTHVLLETNERGVPPRLSALAGPRGWQVLTVSLDESVDEIRAGVERLADLVEGPTRSERVGAIEAEMARAWRERPGLGDRVGRVLLLVGVDPPGVLGPGSFHFDLVERLGAHPVPEAGAMFIRMSAEDVLRLDPDSIALFMPGVEGGDTHSHLGVLGRIGLRAVEEGRVMIVSHPHALTPSTAMIAVADEFAAGGAAWAPIDAGAPAKGER
jgi:iron complex transport system substrate-binding protein